MTDRNTQIAAFLSGSPWESWIATPLTGDASTRRYMRLSTGTGASVILMDDDPATGQSTQQFATLAAWLHRQKLRAPVIHLHDEPRGLMLLEDFGTNDIAHWARTSPADTATMYKGAVDVLISLRSAAPPTGLIQMTPQVGGDMLSVTTEWYAQTTGPQLCAAMTDCLAQFCPIAGTLAMRDYHAENLMWLPDQSGTDRIGLLDFQDAFVAPDGYDLVSLLRDVRRVVDPALARDMTNYFVAQTGIDTQAFQTAFACLAVQRNLRILGMFARLVLRDNKPRYAKMVPHLWAMIASDMANPALAPLASAITEILPPPEASPLKDFL